MKVLIINGPNLNMLGIREPEVYGRETYDELMRKVELHCQIKGIFDEIYQSNHEGDLVDKIQDAYGRVDGIVINPAAYTHTSVAILDALLAVNIPAVEVHFSNPMEREEFRHVSYVGKACIKTIVGHGIDGYIEAIDCLAEYVKK